MNEEKIASVNIGIGLSSQLITVAIAIIGLIGTHFVFAQDKKILSCAYYAFISIAIIVLVCSILIGGKGINVARNNGFKGEWDIQKTKCHFNYQGIFLLVGMGVFGGAVISSTLCKSTENSQISEINQKILSLTRENSSLSLKIDTLSRSNIELFAKLNCLQLSIANQANLKPNADR